MLDPVPKLDSRLPSVVVTADMYERLRSLSDSTNISMSEIIRRAVSVFLAENANSISENHKDNSRNEVTR